MMASQQQVDDLYERVIEKDSTIAELRAEVERLKADADRLEWLAEQGLCWRGHDTVDKGWKPGKWLYRGCCMNYRAEIDRHRDTLASTDTTSDKRVDKENWTASFLDSLNTHLRECGVFHGHDQVKNAADGLSVLRSIFGHANSDRSELSTAHKSLAVLREVCNAREQHYFEPTVGTLHRLNLAEAAMDSSQALTVPKAIGNKTSVKVEQVTHATLDAKSLYEISVCANALDGLTRLSGPDANTRTTETAAYWSKKLRALVDNHMRRGAEVAAELYSPAKNSSCGK
jgi:hypothetical protein